VPFLQSGAGDFYVTTNAKMICPRIEMASAAIRTISKIRLMTHPQNLHERHENRSGEFKFAVSNFAAISGG
jgi:hypothetical protein